MHSKGQTKRISLGLQAQASRAHQCRGPPWWAATACAWRSSAAAWPCCSCPHPWAPRSAPPIAGQIAWHHHQPLPSLRRGNKLCLCPLEIQMSGLSCVLKVAALSLGPTCSCMPLMLCATSGQSEVKHASSALPLHQSEAADCTVWLPRHKKRSGAHKGARASRAGSFGSPPTLLQQAVGVDVGGHRGLICLVSACCLGESGICDAMLATVSR